ncbi:MAG: flagellar biosynthetic protein FliO [Candidatus Gastranaerophilales bacterium]|nr:flagellar biosynthetic protein FliO [Candidatus Gastranaerophilales bacterium]
MNTYIINFAVYTLAMIGFIVLALYIYKKSVYTPFNNKNKDFLSIENNLKLSPTKAIYVLKAGKERFLVAADAANTTMLAKLDIDNVEARPEESGQNAKIMDFSVIQKLMKR